MRNTRGLAALLLALCMLFNATFEIYAAVDGGQDETFAPDEMLQEQLYPETDVDETELSQEDQLEGLEEIDSGRPEAQLGDRNEALAEERVMETSGSYVFVVSDPGEDNYREWETPTIRYGERYQYDLHLAWHENGVYEIVSTKEKDMGVGLVTTVAPVMSIVWYEGYGHMLEIDAEWQGNYELGMWCEPPGTMQRVNAKLGVYVIEPVWEYAFAVAAPGSEDYNRWQDHTMQVGQVVRYDLHFMWYNNMENSSGRVSTLEEGMGIDLTYEAEPPFYLYWDWYGGTHLEIAPSEPGTYSLLLECTLPNGERTVFELKIEVPDATYVFVVADPGQDNYREWETLTIGRWEQYQYDLHLARYENGVYKIVSTKEEDMGVGFNAILEDPVFDIVWYEGYGHMLEINGIWEGYHELRMWCDPPFIMERVSAWLGVHIIVKREYAFSIAEPGSDIIFDRWQDHTIEVGEIVQYDLYFLWYNEADKEFGRVSTLEEGMGIDLTYEAAPPFHLYWDEQGTHLEIAPTEPGTFSLLLECTIPGGDGERAVFELRVEVPDVYVLVVSDPGEDNYQRWNGRTIHEGEQYQYDLHLARYQPDTGGYEIVSTKEQDMGVGFVAVPTNPNIQAVWYEGYGYKLEVDGSSLGTYTLGMTFNCPWPEKQVEVTFELHVIEHSWEYAFVVASPGSKDWRHWRDCAVRVGQVMRYDLDFMWYNDYLTQFGSTLGEDMGMGLTFEAAPPFRLYWEEGGYHLEFAPTELGTYSMLLEYTHPSDGQRATFELTIEAVDRYYGFVIAEPGSNDYRPWQDMTVEVGETYQYDFSFARYEDGECEIIATEELGMGIDLMSLSPSGQFFVNWIEGEVYSVRVQPHAAGTYEVQLYYTHPDTGDRIQDWLVLHAVEREYTVLIAEPGSGEYRPWVDTSIRVGEEARYTLRLGRKTGGSFQMDTETEWWINDSSQANYTLSREEDGGYSLHLHPVLPGNVSIGVYYINPVTGQYSSISLQLRVVAKDLLGDLFTVTAPGGGVSYWNERSTGSVTVYYDSGYNPKQTLQIAGREDDWNLWDPEGSLRQISSGPDGTVYEMVRPTWEQPCEFRQGDTVMPVYILLPSRIKTHFAVYDEALADRAPAILPKLDHDSLKPDQETRLVVVMTENGFSTLLSDPLDLIRTDRPVALSAPEGAEYFSITPDAGELTLGIERGRSQTVKVQGRETVRFYVSRTPPTGTFSIMHGDTLRTRIRVHVRERSFGNIVRGQGRFARSSNPSVIQVELDEEDEDTFFINPVGFGEAVIYLDGDEYDCEVLLSVRDIPVTVEAQHHDPTDLGIPSSIDRWGPPIMLPSNFEGTPENPFILPCFTRVMAHKSHEVINLWSYDGAEGRFISSDPSVVEVIDEDCFTAYLNPVGPGVCTITYIEGAFVKEVTVRSEPDALKEVGYIAPGFYTYYGSAHFRRDAVSLADGLPIVAALEPHPNAGLRGKLELDRFQFSTPGVVKVELMEAYTFSLIPMGNGVTTLTYATQSGYTYALEISVGLPEPVWDFVVPDDTKKSGYRLWQGERAAVGDRLEQEVFFAQLILAEDGSIHTVKLLDRPADLAVEAQDPAVFNLVGRGKSLYAWAAPREEGEYALTITATPPEASVPQTWVKYLYSSQVIAVTENTVAAINEAIRTAPLTEGYESVILLPRGYIPMDGDTPVLLDRPVTLRGQEDTVLASDVAALSHVPGAKLQNLTIRFDDTSTYNGIEGFRTRFRYPSTVNLYVNDIDLGRLLYAIVGDGLVTLENCELDGGTVQNRCQYGIAVTGNGVAFQGVNTIRNFSEAGWKIYSVQGPRRYFRGLTFTGNKIGVSVESYGSTDPYFIRLIESNFLDNAINVQSDFPVNFSHNYFHGGEDAENITKSPQYTERLEFGGTGAPVEYPNLLIEVERLAFAEVLNFEGRAPIDSANFAQADGPVQIAVKELDSAGVGAEDSADVLLQWTFAPVQTVDEAPLFRADAYIDEVFSLPPDSGIEAYQGVSFAHHGPLPMVGAEISVQKRVLFQEETLYLYRLANDVLTYVGEIDNTSGEFYTFFLDGCSDYVITNAVVESAGGGDENGSGNEGGGKEPGDGDNGSGEEQGGGPGDGNGSGSGGDGGAGTDNNEKDGNKSGGNGAVSKTGPASGPDHFADSIQDTAVLPYNPPNAFFPEGAQYPPAGSGEGIFGAEGLPTNGAVSGNTELAAVYTHIPAPPNQMEAPRTVSANRYVDDAAIRSAFAIPYDGQVVIDVSVKTAVSPLAFQLLAESPTLILVLKGDGYEWRFSGEDIREEATLDAFDTSVNWNTAQDGEYARLSFAQQEGLPGNCELILEAGNRPQEWVAYRGDQSGYTPCTLNTQQQGMRLRLDLDTLGDYVAIL